MHIAMIPHAASGGNSAIEDGAVLGECVDWARKHGRSISDATLAYETIRKPRVEKLQELSRRMYSFSNCGGEEAAKRDAMLAQMTEVEAKKLSEKSEEERRAMPRAVADPDATPQTPPYRMWLRGFDAVGEARKYLEEHTPAA
jgi:2-polyprenyl-6-methoxyphenol hydroxylase-like FAD-dependent oxidoreductase